MTYPGGKGNCYHLLINQIPPHRCFISAFLGHCAIMRFKERAIVNIGIDKDPEAIANFREHRDMMLHTVDAIPYLIESSFVHVPTTFLYCDPPYLLDTRKTPRQKYRYEMSTEKEHTRLLELLLSFECMVMISGYWSSLYMTMLKDWRWMSFETMTRGGTMATEYVWMNYPEPVVLHDYRYLGDDYRDRERIRRMQQRWTKKFDALPPLEQRAMLRSLTDLCDESAVQEVG